MSRLLLLIVFACLSLLGSIGVHAATCGCAAVPLLDAIDTSANQAGDFYINFTTESHEMNDLVVGSKQISDETNRRRSSFSQAVSMSYAISDRWAVSGLVSYIEHSRKVGTSLFGEQNTSGLSDGVILLRYTPIYQTPFSRHQLSLGFGLRLPIGKDDAGGVLTASEDMQPSIGARGSIYWGSYSYAFNQAATIQFNASVSYIDNDEENDRGYTFADEVNFTAGLSQNIGIKFAYSASLRYRNTTADQRNGFDIPNTGGQWLDFVPAVQYSFTDKLDLGLSGRVPIARDLDGAIQFTTSYSYAVSLTYAL
ncbi:MAG: transporter [Proteobacteria bacterium]|nr:transporter [Pseudomonadota bacterium]